MNMVSCTRLSRRLTSLICQNEHAITAERQSILIQQKTFVDRILIIYLFSMKEKTMKKLIEWAMHQTRKNALETARVFLRRLARVWPYREYDLRDHSLIGVLTRSDVSLTRASQQGSPCVN